VLAEQNVFLYMRIHVSHAVIVTLIYPPK